MLDNFAGRGGRPTARLSAEEAKFQVFEKPLLLWATNDNKAEACLKLLLQEDLQLALRVSSEEDLGGGGEDSDNDFDGRMRGQKRKGSHAASKKETNLVVFKDEGSIILGDSEDEGQFAFFFFFVLVSVFVSEAAVAKCPNSSSTTVVLGEEDRGEVEAKDGGEVNAKGDCENIVLEDSEEDEETEVVKVVQEQLPRKNLKEEPVAEKNSKPKRTTVGETWVVGERSRRSSGDSDKRSRKKPQKYVESSDSENDLDGVIDSDESDEEFEEIKKKKQAKTKQAPSKRPNKIQAGKKSATSKASENPDLKFKQSRVLERKDQPAPDSPVRPFGIHNPSSPSRPSAIPSPTTTPTPSLSLPALLKLKTGAGGSKPSSPNQQRGSPAWKPPAKV